MHVVVKQMRALARRGVESTLMLKDSLARRLGPNGASVSGRPVVLTYPRRVQARAYTLYQICRALDVHLSHDPRRPWDLAIYWEDATFRTPGPMLQALMRRGRALNTGSTDISKRHVARVFEEVFGYSVEVDPRAHRGWCVEKSDRNATHDGRIRRCPVEPLPGKVYQKLVDTVGAHGYAEDLRTPVMGDVIPFVYLKHKKPEARLAMSFGGTIAPVAEVYTADEVARILTFCGWLGLDFCELDILRDRDGRLYVVDANSTPTIRFFGYSAEDERQARALLARTFDQQFLQPLRARAASRTL
jgi:hypothetical protein